MFRMDKRLLKKKVFDACLKIQLERIEHIELAVDEAQKSANEYGQPKDRYDSYRMQLLSKRDMFGQQLKTGLEQLETLNKIDLTITHNKVSFGAIVITNAQKIFVSIGIGKISVENDNYYSISPMVPFYQAMKDLKKGDDFVFRAKTFKIIDVY